MFQGPLIFHCQDSLCSPPGQCAKKGGVLGIFQCVEYGQRKDTLPEIYVDRLPLPGFVGDKIQDIISDLEEITQMFAECAMASKIFFSQPLSIAPALQAVINNDAVLPNIFASYCPAVVSVL